MEYHVEWGQILCLVFILLSFWKNRGLHANLHRISGRTRAMVRDTERRLGRAEADFLAKGTEEGQNDEPDTYRPRIW